MKRFSRRLGLAVHRILKTISGRALLSLEQKLESERKNRQALERYTYDTAKAHDYELARLSKSLEELQVRHHGQKEELERMLIDREALLLRLTSLEVQRKALP